MSLGLGVYERAQTASDTRFCFTVNEVMGHAVTAVEVIGLNTAKLVLRGYPYYRKKHFNTKRK